MSSAVPVDRDALELAAKLIEQAQTLIAGKAHRPLGLDDWISVSELASRTSKNRSTVRRWITEGKLPAKRLPGTSGYLVRYGDFLEWNAEDEESRRALDAVVGRLAS